MLIPLSDLEVIKRHFNLERDFTEDEIDMIKSAYNELGSEQKNIVCECFRLDVVTGKLIQHGYVVFDAYHFEEEEQAIQWVNENTDLQVSDFGQLYEMSENGYIDDCYYTEWS